MWLSPYNCLLYPYYNKDCHRLGSLFRSRISSQTCCLDASHRQEVAPPLANGSIIVRSRGPLPERRRIPRSFAGMKYGNFGNWVDLGSEVAYVSNVRTACRVGWSDRHPHYPPDLSQHAHHARGRFHRPPRG